MLNTLVRDWMTPHPVTVPRDTTLPEAHKMMTERRIRRLLVLDGDQLVGIVTRGDVRGAQPSEATSLSIWEINYLLSRLTVDRIMSKTLITANVNMTVGEAAKIMLDHKIAGLPVMDGGTLAGIITESDIFRMVVNTWGKENAK